MWWAVAQILILIRQILPVTAFQCGLHFPNCIRRIYIFDIQLSSFWTASFYYKSVGTVNIVQIVNQTMSLINKSPHFRHGAVE